MTTIESITVEAARDLAGGRPALVLGQDASSRTARMDIARDLLAIATTAFGDDVASRLADATDFPSTLDELAGTHSAQYDQFHVQAARYLQALKASFLTEKLGRVSWSTVISLSLDSCIEDAIKNVLSSKPTQRHVTVISSPTVLGRPALHLPIFKLLGSCRDVGETSRVALARSEELLKVQEWRQLLAPVRDYLRDGGIFFIGVENEVQRMRDLLSSLYAGHAPYPGRLFFLDSDQCGSDPVIQRLAKGKSEVHRVKGTADDLARALDTPAALQLTLQLPLPMSAGEVEQEYKQFRTVVELVPGGAHIDPPQSLRQEAFDSLFRPTGSQWYAFLSDLDLPRTQTSQIVETLISVQVARTQKPKVVVVRGEAGVGKTVVAKRVAVELRRAGHIVLWARKLTGNFFQPFRELAQHLRTVSTRASDRKAAYIFCDDPWALGISPIEVTAIFDSAGVDATIVFVMRNTDRAAHRSSLRLPQTIDAEIQLSFELSADEQENLPKFLVSAGAAQNISDATRILGLYKEKNATDILCRLWYLLPDTRSQLEASLEDEYFRLENVDDAIGEIAGEAGAQSAIARRAYEAVAVASGIGVGVPLEVLVGALQVNYSDWMGMCSNGQPLWGLLYPVQYSDSEDIWYFTRNEVVTQVLLRHINGGVGHATDVRVLNSLVEACTGTSPAYREFLIEVLVRNKDALRKVVTPREGRELYERAIRSFPVPDRALVHHFGKWVTDEEHLHEEAYAILERALETADYPYGSQEERREHVHTSMAAVVVQRIKRGVQDRESGIGAIKRHLKEASSPSFFNLYTVHVQVNALIGLQQGDDPISLDCFVESFRAIERAQQLAGASGRHQMRFHEALGLLEDQKRQLAVYLPPFGSLKELALTRFEATGDQLPLEAAAIRGLLDASIDDNGTKYNEVFQFLRSCQERLAKMHKHLSSGLRQVRIDLMVRWRLQHERGDMDWSTFMGDIACVRDDPSRRDDVLLLFYEGVAAFHLRLASEANAAFTRLRALQLPGVLLRQSRLYLRDKNGKPEQLQGQYFKGGGPGKVRIAEMGLDVPIARGAPPEGTQTGAVVHCWIAFTFQGPLAEFREPDPKTLLLPN